MEIYRATAQADGTWVADTTKALVPTPFEYSRNMAQLRAIQTHELSQLRRQHRAERVLHRHQRRREQVSSSPADAADAADAATPTERPQRAAATTASQRWLTQLQDGSDEEDEQHAVVTELASMAATMEAVLDTMEEEDAEDVDVDEDDESLSADDSPTQSDLDFIASEDEDGYDEDYEPSDNSDNDMFFGEMGDDVDDDESVTLGVPQGILHRTAFNELVRTFRRGLAMMRNIDASNSAAPSQ